VNDKTFKTLEMPEMAKRQALEVARSFGGILPTDDASFMQQMACFLDELMEIKVDILYAAGM
jgi:hypothetical protein